MSVWLLAGGLLAATLQAAPTVPAASRYVVIVANNRPFDGDLKTLHYADDDGALFAELLAPYARRVVLLTTLDDESQRRFPDVAGRTEPPDRARLTATLEALNREMSSAAGPTELLFIYVGHGSVDEEGKGYLHLTDGRLTRADLFRDVIAGSRASVTHVVLDACNAFAVVGGRGEGDDPTFEQFESFLSGQDLERYPTVGVLTATSESRQVHEWSRIRSGVFSHQLRSALSGAADVNEDGLLEYSEIAAFVDAANVRLPVSAGRLEAFAWAPRQNRHKPLLDLRTGEGLRRVLVGPELVGRFTVESAVGERWADLHKAKSTAVTLVLPASRSFFFRDDEHELEIPAGHQDLSIREPLLRLRPIAARGGLDVAFEQGLFAAPFGRDYYDGFVSGRSHMSAVPFSAPAARPWTSQLEPAPRTFRFEAGYVLAPSTVESGYADHGLFFRAGMPVASALWATVTAEAGTGEFARGGRFWRGALMPGILWVRPLTRPISVFAGAEAGWGAVAQFASETSADGSVFLMRARSGAEVRLGSRLFLLLGGAFSASWMTVNEGEVLRTRPELHLGLSW